KTTLLGLIAGLAQPTTGTIVRSDDSSVAIGTATPGFAETLSVRRNVELACTVRGRAMDAEQTAAIDAALTAVSMIGLAARPVATLSGGERQRAAIVRAVASGAPLVLLDEPTSQLDQGLARQVARFLGDEARRGRAIVCASHEPELLATADRVHSLHR
ncbi:MAG TPA: ATP-binding cassette domain-containing protein, partial [Ilumatobacteraceae bacterium]